jgi:MFS family permease
MTSPDGTEPGAHEAGRFAVESDVDREGDAFSWRLVTSLLLTSTLNPINSSLIATALVPIAHALSVPVGRTAILVSALYLASSIAQPTAGKLAEEFGPRRVLIVGILFVLLGGVIGGVAQDIPTLAVARVLIGIGTSAGYPTAMVIIRRRTILAGMSEPPGRVLGGLTIAGTVTVAVGPPIGGVLVDLLGWRSTFLVNIPITATALLLTMAWVPKDEPLQRRPLREIASRIDISGIVLFGGTMSALLVLLLSLPTPQWIPLGLAIALCVVLVLWELRAATPFIDMRLLVSNLALTRTYVRGALTLLSFYTVLYGLTQWMQAARGLVAPRRGVGAAADGYRRRDRVAADLRAQPRPRPAGRRCREPDACVSSDRAVDLAHSRRRDRRRHVAFRDHAGHHHGGKPDRNLYPGTRRTCRHRGRALSHLRIPRLHRVIDDHRNRLPPQRHRLRHAPRRRNPGRGQHRRAGLDGARPEPQDAESLASRGGTEHGQLTRNRPRSGPPDRRHIPGSCVSPSRWSLPRTLGGSPSAVVRQLN